MTPFRLKYLNIPLSLTEILSIMFRLPLTIIQDHGKNITETINQPKRPDISSEWLGRISQGKLRPRNVYATLSYVTPYWMITAS